MNIAEMKKVLPILMSKKIVPFIWGRQGAGKTQVVKQVADDLGIGMVHLHLATQEVGDLVGLLIPSDKAGEVKHARPEWFPLEGRGIIFLDELNRAHPDVLSAMFSFILSGTIHVHKLPPGWSIVAAGNYQSNAFNVTDTSDAAWMSRFCHLDFSPSVEEFTMYADKGAPDVADFIRTQPTLLNIPHKDRLNTNQIVPNERGWLDMVGPLEAEALGESRYEVYSGIVGASAAAAYLTFKKQGMSKIRGRDILDAYGSVRERVLKASTNKEARLDLLNGAVDEIKGLLEDRKTLSEEAEKNFKTFLLDIPLEMGLKVVEMLKTSPWDNKNSVLNDKEFISLFRKKL